MRGCVGAWATLAQSRSGGVAVVVVVVGVCVWGGRVWGRLVVVVVVVVVCVWEGG